MQDTLIQCIVPYYHYLLILDYTYPMLVYVVCTYLIAFSLCSIECEIKPSLDCYDPADAFQNYDATWYRLVIRNSRFFKNLQNKSKTGNDA